MATKEQIREALAKAGEALRNLESLVGEGIPEDMWVGGDEDQEMDDIQEAFEISYTLFPLYCENEYQEVENYAEYLMEKGR